MREITHTFDLAPVPRPIVRGSEHWGWWDFVDAELIRQAHAFRAGYNVAEVADRLREMKANNPTLGWLIQHNTELLAALRGDPRPYLAMMWAAMSGCSRTKVHLATWREAFDARENERIAA